VKIFADLGHGGLAGEHPDEFLKEVRAAHERSAGKKTDGEQKDEI